MAEETTRQPGSKDIGSWKPGSEAAEAKNVGGEGDFGVPVGSGTSRQRDYVSENTKRSDPGAALPRSGEDDGGEGVRETGAGAEAANVGDGSGGDLDPDIIGFGSGTGIAAVAPTGDLAADETDGTSDEMASGAHADGRNQSPDEVGQVGGSKRIKATVVSRADDLHTAPDGQGAAAVTNPGARGDDSFAGEVSLGEASGEDLGMSPSSDTQGLSQEDNQGYQKDFADEG